jgi:hypothetical protein
MTLNDARMVQVLDTNQNAGIVLMPKRGGICRWIANLPGSSRKDYR